MQQRHWDNPMLSILAIITVATAIMVALMAWQGTGAPSFASDQPQAGLIGSVGSDSACFLVPTRQAFVAGLSTPAVGLRLPPATAHEAPCAVQ